MLPWWHERREALTRHVRVGFKFDVHDGAGVTCTSIAIFLFLSLSSDSSRSIDLGDLTASP